MFRFRVSTAQRRRCSRISTRLSLPSSSSLSVFPIDAMARSPAGAATATGASCMWPRHSPLRVAATVGALFRGRPTGGRRPVADARRAPGTRAALQSRLRYRVATPCGRPGRRGVRAPLRAVAAPPLRRPRRQKLDRRARRAASRRWPSSAPCSTSRSSLRRVGALRPEGAPPSARYSEPGRLRPVLRSNQLTRHFHSPVQQFEHRVVLVLLVVLLTYNHQRRHDPPHGARAASAARPTRRGPAAYRRPSRSRAAGPGRARRRRTPSARYRAERQRPWVRSRQHGFRGGTIGSSRAPRSRSRSAASVAGDAFASSFASLGVEQRAPRAPHPRLPQVQLVAARVAPKYFGVRAPRLRAAPAVQVDLA